MLDWRVESDYDYTTSLENNQWAWEYLRRNTDYQNDIRDLQVLVAELTNDLGCDVLEVGERSLTSPRAWHFDPAINHRETIKQWETRCTRNSQERKRTVIWKWKANQWGLKTPMWIAGTDEPPEFLPYSNYPHIVRHYDEVINYYSGPDEGSQLESPFAVVVFDLTKTISNELDSIEPELDELKSQFELGNTRNRIHVAKNRTYLRVLDAYSDGATTREVASIIFHNIENDYASRYPGDRRATDTRDQAMRLVNGRYRLLLVS